MTGPYNLDKLIEDNLTKKIIISGIYIWGVKNGTEYIPIYVGKAKKIPQRIYEHLCAWRGGAYQIPKWDDIINKNKFSKFIHEPNGFSDFKILMGNNEAQETIDNVLSNFFCCWKELSDYQNKTNKEVEEIESALANIFLKSQSLISHKHENFKENPFAMEFYNEWIEKNNLK